MPFVAHLKKYQFPIFLALGLRIVYSLWSAVVWWMVDSAFPLTSTALWETYHNLTRSSTLPGRALIDVWLRWDAVHYMNIAAFGYKGAGDTVFFPLYPVLVGGLARITTLNVTLVGILVSSLAALLLLVCFYDLVLCLFEDAALAKWSVGLFALYPTALFLHAPFTDALFLLCSVASILMLVRKKPVLAGVFACAAGLTRPQGMLLIIPMLVVYIQTHWRDRQLFQWREALGLVIAPLGFGAYSLWRASFGMADMVQSLEQYSNVRFQDPLTTLFKAAAAIVQNPSLIEISELVSVLLFLAILIWMVTRPQFRQHPALLLYSAATWLLITSKTTIDGSPLQSANRYVLHIFFVFVGLAFLLLKFPDRHRKMIVLIFSVLGMIVATLSALWVFVG